jgi:hypothetical protein
MNHNLHRTLHYPYWHAITSVPPSKLIAIFLAIVVPGGFLVPVCYAAYAAIRRSWCE